MDSGRERVLPGGSLREMAGARFEDMHTLHESVRELSSGQRRVEEELGRERERGRRLELAALNKVLTFLTLSASWLYRLIVNFEGAAQTNARSMGNLGIFTNACRACVCVWVSCMHFPFLRLSRQ